jgi:O-antigen/teichoic acid export membrane protein
MTFVNTIAILLRSGSAAARFLFVIYLAMVADAAMVGQAALITTIAALFTQVAGLEVHQVLGRKLHAMSERERQIHFMHQGFISVVAYLVLIPVAAFAYPEIVFQHLPLVGLIFVLEHFITEVFRLNILLLQPLRATRLLAMKNISWILVFIAVVESGIAVPSLQLMLWCWIGMLAAIATPLLWRARVFSYGRNFFAIYSWGGEASRLLRDARPFMVSATAVACTGAVDKLIMGRYFSLAELGIYYFYQSCAMVPSLIATFTLGTTLWPQCVKAATLKEENRYRREWHRILRLFWVISVGACVVVSLALPILLEFINKPDYGARLAVFYWLLGASSLSTLCDPHKLHLFVTHRDRALVIGNISQLLLMVVLIAVACIYGNLTTVAACSAVAALSALLVFQFALNGNAPREVIS